jgi:transcriptional regulator with XRE-family HTH domain
VFAVPHFLFFVQNYRIDRKLTMRELSRESGISHTEIEKIESGKLIPSLPTLLALSIALGCDVKDLFTTVA